MPIGPAGRQKKILIILGLVVLTLATYWQVQNFGFVNYDDQLYITQNSLTQSGLTCNGIVKILTDTRTGNWHPLTMMSHILDWDLFGPNAGGHHWSSLFIHILNVVLLFYLLNQATGALWRSAMVAVLFAIHPINVESVAWVAERKNVLSTFFWFLTMLFYIRYVKRPEWKHYLPVFLCFAFGLMSKPMLVTLPFVLLLIDYWPLHRTRIDVLNAPQAEIQGPLQSEKANLISLIFEKIPLFILSAISIGITLYTQRAVGAMVNMDSLPMSRRIGNAVFSYGLYLKQMFWPIDLSVFYPQYNIPAWKLLMASTFLILVTAMVIRYYRKQPYLLVGWFWYLGTLVPVIGLVQVGAQSMADRYAYVPFVGLFIMLVWFVAEVAKTNKYMKTVITLTFLFLVSVLSVICWQRCQLWGDQLYLWNDALKHHPSALAFNLRGLAYADQGENSRALVDYQSALELDKKFAEVFNNRGNLYVAIGQDENALRDYEEAQRLKPAYADVYYNRGLLYIKNRQWDEAVAQFTTAIHLDPDAADYYNNRGVALRFKGEYKKAFADFNQALSINRNLAEAYYNRGVIFTIYKQYNFSIAEFTETLKRKPAYLDARFRRGISFAFLGQYDQAIDDLNHVLQGDPRHVPALINLGIVLKTMKRYEEASVPFQKSLQINPNDQEALKYLKEIESLKKKH